MGRQVFTAGEILTAASMNDLGDQTVMVFDDATARATAIPTPVEGMVTYLKDTDRLEQFDGTNFVVAAPPQTGVLQVVSTTKTDIYSVSVAAGGIDTQNVPSLEASITPQNASNKIMVLISLNSLRCHVYLQRDGAVSVRGDAASNRQRATFSNDFGLSVGNQQGTFIFLDDATSTSLTTYGIRVGNLHQTGADTIKVNASNSDNDNNQFARYVSTITLMEVAA